MPNPRYLITNRQVYHESISGQNGVVAQYPHSLMCKVSAVIEYKGNEIEK